MIFENRNDHAYHGSRRQVMPPPRTPSPIHYYRCDHPGWDAQPLQNKGHLTAQIIGCSQCYAHDTICQIAECVMGTGKTLSQALKV